jgi:DNA-binding response OmpR family regulator
MLKHRSAIPMASTADEAKRLAVAALDELEETIRQLSRVEDTEQTFPKAWRLTPAEATVLRVLYATPGPVRWQVIVAASSGDIDDPRAVLRVNVCRLRGKLAKAGLADVIITRDWIGYEMPPEARARLGEAIGPAFSLAAE